MGKTYLNKLLKMSDSQKSKHKDLRDEIYRLLYYFKPYVIQSLKSIQLKPFTEKQQRALLRIKKSAPQPKVLAAPTKISPALKRKRPEDDPHTCVICLDEKVNCMLCPCQHVVTCFDCSDG